MESQKPKTNYLPWVLLAIAVIGCFALGAFLVFSLAFNLLSIGGNIEYPASGNVAVVEISGIIKGSKDIVSTLNKLSKNKDVKAIVLRVDSPGGAVAPSQEIYDKVKEISKTKVIVASIGALAASGGYYIIAPANKIVANPGSVTGSIGVIIEFFVVKDLLKKLYVDWRVIKSGEVKDMGSPLRNLTDKEIKILQEATDNIHMQFKRAVSESRKIPIEKINQIADGRVFTGEQAVALKLVDELGGLEKACNLAAKMSGIKGEPKLFYPETTKRKFWQYMAEDLSERFFSKIEEKGYSFSPLLMTTR